MLIDDCLAIYQKPPGFNIYRVVKTLWSFQNTTRFLHRKPREFFCWELKDRRGRKDPLGRKDLRSGIQTSTKKVPGFPRGL